MRLKDKLDGHQKTLQTRRKSGTRLTIWHRPLIR
jgi:hypothetical protein